MDYFFIFFVIWLVLPIILFVMWYRARPAARIGKVVSEANSELVQIKEQTQSLTSSYKEKRELLQKLEDIVAIYEEKIDLADLGIYEPHFEFQDSDSYKAAITEIRDKQKYLISSKTAAYVPKSWTVNGSESKGRAMVNRQLKLTMRAFNNECEAAIANVRWNNFLVMEKRILRSAEQINKSNESMGVEILEQYIQLRLDELRMTHEYRESKKREREERAEMLRAQREEKALQKEVERAVLEEQRYQALLEEARKEVGIDQNRIAELESALHAAHAASEKARSLAEMTKSGYVYVISNIGSFGDDVVKIGLTRRQDPEDRIKELGDASVPFGFDIHAMIYSDDAPALETALHQNFTDRRVNKSNLRKEFFRVSLEEIELAVKTLHPRADFFKDREAQEWFETLAYRDEIIKGAEKASSQFPSEI